MPTLTGSWQAGDRARIVCVYDDGYVDFYLDTRYSAIDSSNTWAVSGSLGSHSGSNTNYDHGNSGGSTRFVRLSRGSTAALNLAASVSGMNAFGQTISGSFSIPASVPPPPPAQPPVVTGFQASNVTSTGFIADLTGVDANGGTLTYSQVQGNTVASADGAWSGSGPYADRPVIGLKRATRYYFRMRVATNTFGWGPWTAWKTVTTLTDTPGEPNRNWAILNVTAVSGEAASLGVQDNGGLPLTGWQAEYKIGLNGDSEYVASNGGSVRPVMTPLRPGTLYYARVRARNARGYGDWSSWKTFTTLPGLYMKIDGVWRVVAPYVKVKGVWKPASWYVKRLGVWR